MGGFAILLAMIASVVAGCAAPASSLPAPTVVPSPEVICDRSQFQPAPKLTCAPAIHAAEAVLAATHPAILHEEFRWGGLCPPGVPCAPPYGDAGVVIFDFAGGPSLFVYVSADAGGVVAASPPAPYPSGY